MQSNLRCLLITLLAIPAACWGQGMQSKTDSIWLGSALRLGMPRDVVMSGLAEQYKLMRIGTNDDWLVGSKTTRAASLGEVSFSNGRLDYVSRDWSSVEEDGFSVAQALYGLLEQFGREERHNCAVNTETSRTPEAETRTITMTCGIKRLVVTTIEILAGEHKDKSVQIQEVLTQEPRKR